MIDLQNPVGGAVWGEEVQELCFGHVKFEMVLNTQVEMSSQQLDLHLEFR